MNRDYMQSMLDTGLNYLPKLAAATFAAVVFWLILRLVSKLVRLAFAKTEIALEMQGLLLRVARYVVIAVGSISVLDQ